MAISRRDFLKASIATALASPSVRQVKAMANNKNTSLFPSHEPLGNGIGVHPGRVVWMHDPQAVAWDGNGYWWQPENFAEDTVLAMVRSGIRKLTEEPNPAAAWQTLFFWHNKYRGKDGGYRPGQKIAIKANMNGAGAYFDDQKGETHESYANPVLLEALLFSLISDGNIAPSDITLYDAGRIFPEYLREMCSKDILRGVHFRHRNPGGSLDAVADKAASVKWAQAISGSESYLPVCVTEADYLVNLANLKGHSYGFTLCGKNHFGSIVNEDRLRTPQHAGLHPHVSSCKMGDYAVLTDLMANRQLGGKTILYILDALITAPGESTGINLKNSLWRQQPFNGHFASSLFFSQDPVAIDSVGADFLVNEPVMLENNPTLRRNHGIENYLHEAALISSPPSGTVYSDGYGKTVGNLGVHEHWNNAKEKKYSRNLGKSEGIELVRGYNQDTR